MRLISGVLVTAMGIALLRSTPWAIVQILGGALLVWRGVRDEIKRVEKG